MLAGLFGAAVLVQFRTELTDALDEGLRDRFTNIERALAQTPEGSVRERIVPVLPQGESFAQVLDADGHVLAASPQALRRRSVLSASELASARVGRDTLVRAVPPDRESARLLVGPTGPRDDPFVLVVGTRLSEGRRAEARLEVALGVGLPVLVGLVSLGGWLLAGAALSPVRSMIEEADEMSAREPGRRLTVPVHGGAEVVQLAERLNALLARIETAVVHERQFLDDASHELRTPLAILRGEVELARLEAAPESDLARALDSVLEEISRLEHLTADLLVLARTRATPAVRREPTDLQALARAAVDALSRLDPGAPPVSVTGAARAEVDPRAFDRVLRNLVENARRHARGGVEVRLRREPSGDAVIEVADDGPGFPADLVGGQAFERFRHGAAGEQRTGVGLGLAIVAAIVAAHGGEVTAENVAGGGALVRVTIPGDARSGRQDRGAGTGEPAPLEVTPPDRTPPPHPALTPEGRTSERDQHVRRSHDL